MKLTTIEKQFASHSSITQDLTQFPITEIEQHAIRTDNKNTFGEVFTPPALVDKMILISKPEPFKYNLDLCSGMGNFTVRILRYFTNNFPNFNLKHYLTNYHWFNEINPENVKVIIDIFGNKINLLVGPAEMIKYMKHDKDGNWLYVIWYWDGNDWVKDLYKQSELFNEFFDI